MSRQCTLRAQRRRDILGCAPGILFQHHGFDTFGQIAQFLGLSTTGLRAHVSNEAELVRLLCQAQLNDIFNAVCQNTEAPEPVTAMARAVLATAAAHPARHRIYLLHRTMLAENTQKALEARRATVDNAFHFALHARAPEKPFCALRQPARLLVGQLLHAPFWWPAGAPAFEAGWIAQQVGFLTTLPPAANAPVKIVA